MNLDLALLLVISVFALWGALTGFARQLAQVVGAFAAWWAAKPVGELWAPLLAKQASWGITTASVVATVLTFIVIYLLVRWVVTSAVQRLLAGKDPKNRALDRGFGFLASGAKIFGLCWVGLSAATYVEQHVTLAGRRPFTLPEQSLALQWVRQNNLFDYLGTNVDLSLPKLLKGLSVRDVAALHKNPHFTALRKNPSFAPLLTDQKLLKRVEKGEWADLAQDPTVQRALSDPDVLEHLRALAADLGGPASPSR